MNIKWIVLILCMFLSFSLYANGVVVVYTGSSYNTCFSLVQSDVNVQVESQVAIVTTTQVFHNNLGWPMIPKYCFPLPDGASATQLRWKLNDTWYNAGVAAVPQDSLPPGSDSNWSETIKRYLGANPLYFDFPSDNGVVVAGAH